jgi:hypothetical protein
VDKEGETVDYGGRGDPFDIRVVAAEWRLVLQHAEQSRIGSPHIRITVRALRKSFLIESLPEGYALVIQLARRATRLSHRPLSLARRRICEEAGFPVPAESDSEWTRVRVEEEVGSSRRPVRMTVESVPHDVTVLGLIQAETEERARSFRVRLSSGEERTLVREPLGHWYLEEESW